MRFADLHLHTEFSDATYSVEELIRVAKRKGLACISITDHDNVDGLIYLKERVPDPGIEVIPGVELTCDSNDCEVHILGYFIDINNKDFLERLNGIKNSRKKRVYEIAEKLKTLGVTIDPNDVFNLSKNGTVGRLHIARIMHKNGIVTNTNEAFYKFIGDKSPAYVSRFRLTPKEAIDTIKKVGGVSVLAHPYCLKDQDLIYSFINMGIDGIEAYYPEHSTKLTNQYIDLAERYNLVVTGGSDCHGKAKPRPLIGKIKIPYTAVEKLKHKAGVL